MARDYKHRSRNSRQQSTPGWQWLVAGLAFGLTVALWVLPGAAALVWGEGSSIYLTLSRRMPEGVVAIVGAALLFVLPGRDGPAKDPSWTRRASSSTGMPAASEVLIPSPRPR